jgi:hypothetical protein
MPHYFVYIFIEIVYRSLQLPLNENFHFKLFRIVHIVVAPTFRVTTELVTSDEC